jgi:glucosamine-6-phosphate deaminase
MDLSVKLKSNNPLLNRHLGYSSAGQTRMDMLTKYERIPTYIFNESSEASLEVANEIATLIITKQKKGKTCVLGLPTGSTQIGIYAELVRMHKKRA